MLTNDIKEDTQSVHLELGAMARKLGTDIKQTDLEDTINTIGDMKTR